MSENPPPASMQNSRWRLLIGRSAMGLIALILLSGALRAQSQEFDPSTEGKTELPSLTPQRPAGRQALTWKYVGNRQSLKYHLGECEFAAIMSSSRRVGFQFRQQAIDCGMKPCNWCLPEWSARVEGRLLQQGVQSRSTAPD